MDTDIYKNHLKTVIKLRVSLILLVALLIYCKRFFILSLLSISVYKVTNNPDFSMMAADINRGQYEYFNNLSQKYYKLSLKHYKENLENDIYIPSLRAEVKAMIGNFYHCGRGVPQNNILAEKWYKESIKEGYLPAELLLGSIKNNNSQCGKI